MSPLPSATALATLLLAAVLAPCVVGGTIVALGPTVELQLFSDTIFRVARRPSEAPVRKTSLVVQRARPEVACNVSRKEGETVVWTDRVSVHYRKATGLVSFHDSQTGALLLGEAGHEFAKSVDMGQDTYQVEQSWVADHDALYGGGAYQNGLVNLLNSPLQMIQFNTEAVVPYFAGTRRDGRAGFGLLWDNTAWTYLNPPTKALVMPGARESGSVSFVPTSSGEHFFYVGRPFPQPGERPIWPDSSRGYIDVGVTDPAGKTVAALSWSYLSNTPRSMSGGAHLEQGVTYTVTYTWTMDDVGLYIREPDQVRTTLRSAIGDLIDYYFVLAKTPDDAVAGYRTLTGEAPLYARWAYGFWQCRERYHTQEELLSAARGFRDRSIPVDAIVQDWMYWGKLGWGPHWDHANYPDPAGMVAALKALDIRFMVSVWSSFDTTTTFYQQMRKQGWLLGNSTNYDAWNPRARELFYNFSKAAHFSIGVDALWLDASEPENYPNVDVPCHGGSGNALMNSYSLMTTQAIVDGLRRDYPEAQGARVFLLTRSSFAGQQRTGATLWSGDIASSWDSLRRQVSSSIGYQMSGMPYWSEDIGGFFRPGNQYDSADYHDLLTRWFQFGVFTPIFRTHGAGTTTEIWNYGDETMQRINMSAITLRYRLLPYTYSGFVRVEVESYTMQRGLAMDFWDDPKALDVSDQFMWGPALLVAPILTTSAAPKGTATRRLYLPGDRPWVHFHSGESLAPGDGEARFALGEAPVLVRAGSVLLLGPPVQHAVAKADPIEVRVYPGGDANFTLWEDDGASQAYRHGRQTRIRFKWNESTQELHIGDREGSFPEMLQERTFNIFFVRPGHGLGVMGSGQPDAVVHYSGAALRARAAEAGLVV